MMKMILDWALWKDAKWYQFWRPQSGLIGGLISGIIIGTIIGILLRIL